MNPDTIGLQDLVTVLVMAGILAGILVLHFLVALADIRKQIRELRRRAAYHYPGIRPSRSGSHPRGERSPDTTPQERIEES